MVVRCALSDSGQYYLPLYTIIMPSHQTAIGAISLEHKKRYDTITDEEWYILVKV